jgi:mediator of RNA polymerase II transcription subunit 17
VPIFDYNDPFLQVDSNAVESQEATDGSVICDLIYFILHALLLRMHSQLRSLRLGRAGIPRSPGFLNTPRLPLLQPIIDLLQYQSFCQRVQSEVDNMTGAIRTAGIPSTLRFTAVGESGKDLVKLLDEGSALKIGGEAILIIDNKYVILVCSVKTHLNSDPFDLDTLYVSRSYHLRP